MTDSRWDAILNTAATDGDPLADATIDAVYQAHGTERVSELFRSLVHNEDIVPEDMPQPVKDFLAQSGEMPTWADRDLLRVASDVFDQHGLVIVMMLFGASLPVLYATQRGAEVLVMTTRMTERLPRRIYETAQFVLDVTAPGSFDPSGRAVRVTQKVRLMHAAIRHLILQTPKWRERWDDAWGIPVNQADLAGTMMSFSTTVIAALEKSNIHLTEREREGYLHLWKVVGHILGIKPELMPRDYPEAVAMMDAWMRLTHAPSEAGRTLTDVLMHFVQDKLKVFPNLVTDSARFWIGDATADQLGIPGYHWTRLLLSFQRVVWGLENTLNRRIPVLGWLSRWAVRRVLIGMLDVERGGSRPPFRLPPTLRAKVGIGG